jgi:4'-phosphopantetheinyl transferase EntD
LASLFPQLGVIVAEASLDDDAGPVNEAEAALVAGCEEKRRREFALARHCARKALAGLGIVDFALLAGPDRAPIWPASVVGSITHTEGGATGYCGVAVAHRRVAAGLGIDAEPRQPLPAELWPRVLDESEYLAVLDAREPGVFARLVFSAKEAAYKAIYPMRRQFLDFPDIHLEFLPEPGRFVALLVGPATPAANPLLGRFVIDDDLLVTGVIVPAESSPTAEEVLSPRRVPC